MINRSIDDCLFVRWTAAQAPVTCPESGHVTADVDPRSGQGQVIFGGRGPAAWSMTSPVIGAKSDVLPTRHRDTQPADSHRHHSRTTPGTTINIGTEACPWTLRALPGNPPPTSSVPLWRRAGRAITGRR